MPARFRPYLLTAVLLALTLVLAGALTAEWFWLKSGREARLSSKPAGHGALPEEELLPDNFALPGLNQYEQMAERPLFMETRRPSPPAPPGPPPPVKPQVAPPLTFKVMGILATPKGRMTLIADAKGKYKRMKPKDAMDGWQIEHIGPDHVLVEQSGFKEELPLLKKRPKSAVTTTPARVRGAPPHGANPPGKPATPIPPPPANPGMPPRGIPPEEVQDQGETAPEAVPTEGEEETMQNPEDGQ